MRPTSDAVSTKDNYFIWLISFILYHFILLISFILYYFILLISFILHSQMKLEVSNLSLARSLTHTYTLSIRQRLKSNFCPNIPRLAALVNYAWPCFLLGDCP